MSADIQSPCIRNCCLDDQDICIGCGRSLEQIRLWSSYSSEEKANVVSGLDSKRPCRKAVQTFLSGE